MQHKVEVAMPPLPVQPMMTVLCAHSSSKYCALTFSSFPSSGSVFSSLSRPVAIGYLT